MTPSSVKLGSIVSGVCMVVGIALVPFLLIMARLGTHRPVPSLTLPPNVVQALSVTVWTTATIFLVTGTLAIAFMSAALVRHAARA